MSHQLAELTSGGVGAPDRNPRLDCARCEASYPWRAYWQPRMTERDKDPGRPLLCDECLAAAVRYHDRATSNRRLSEFADREVNR